MVRKKVANLKEKTTAFIKSDLGISLGVAILWQVVITFSAILLSHTLSGTFGTTSPYPTDHLLAHTMNWDGAWYNSIIEGSYFNPDSYSAVFFPLFPLIIWLLKTVTFGLVSVPVLGILLNTVCLWFVVFFLKRISEKVLPKINAWIAPAIFLLSPAALFLNMFYVEALLCCLGFGAYYFALTRRWLASCILLALATSTKLAALLFIGLCALEFAQAHGWRIKKIFTDPKILYFFITPIGFIAFAAFLEFARGQALAMFNSIELWSYHRFNPNIFQTFGESIAHLYESLLPGVVFDNIVLVNFALPIIGLLILLAASIYTLVILKNIPLAVFGFVSIVFFTINSNLVSVHRYLLPIFVIYLCVAHLSKHRGLRPFLLAFLYLGVLIQGFLLVLFSTGVFAG